MTLFTVFAPITMVVIHVHVRMDTEVMVSHVMTKMNANQELMFVLITLNAPILMVLMHALAMRITLAMDMNVLKMNQKHVILFVEIIHFVIVI